ncbi:hypothetical protein OFO07_07590 [Campylobacter sp. JMF_06 NA1]|nr:hypothetical protein [Campylobacter sp. JMF_06 NA1]MDA3078777.1 hypothetical protein [Campylobacter sp. JMF_06 NA1]
MDTAPEILNLSVIARRDNAEAIYKAKIKDRANGRILNFLEF